MKLTKAILLGALAIGTMGVHVQTANAQHHSHYHNNEGFLPHYHGPGHIHERPIFKSGYIYSREAIEEIDIALGLLEQNQFEALPNAFEEIDHQIRILQLKERTVSPHTTLRHIHENLRALAEKTPKSLEHNKAKIRVELEQWRVFLEGMVR